LAPRMLVEQNSGQTYYNGIRWSTTPILALFRCYKQLSQVISWFLVFYAVKD